MFLIKIRAHIPELTDRGTNAAVEDTPHYCVPSFGRSHICPSAADRSHIRDSIDSGSHIFLFLLFVDHVSLVSAAGKALTSNYAATLQ